MQKITSIVLINGGERGIRTLGTLLTYTRFPGVLLQPLGHLSTKVNSKYSSSEIVCPAFLIYSLTTGGEGCRVCGGDANIMKIGIITAMPEETRSVVRAIGGAKKRVVNKLVVRQRAVAGNEIVIVEAGMGFDNAATAAKKLICELRPDLIISAGFCGGISAELQVGDAVVATGLTIVSENGLKEVPVTIAE